MDEPFILGSPDGRCWIVHPPRDPYGDGYVYTVTTELRDGAMSAATVAQTDGCGAGPELVSLARFGQELADGWRGWSGVRRWRSVEYELELDASHDGRSHVSLGVTLREPDRYGNGWSARTVFRLEAGEEMMRFAADLAHVLRPAARPERE